MSGWILPSSFAPALGLPKLSIQHYFFQIFIIEVCNGGKNRIRPRLWLGLGKEDGNRRAKKLGQSLQIGNGRLVRSRLPTRDRVRGGIDRLRELLLADAAASESSPQLPNLFTDLCVDVRHERSAFLLQDTTILFVLTQRSTYDILPVVGLYNPTQGIE